LLEQQILVGGAGRAAKLLRDLVVEQACQRDRLAAALTSNMASIWRVTSAGT
jgi:hypothetical protein